MRLKRVLLRSELWGMVFLGFFFLLSCEHAKTPTRPIDLGDIKVLKRGVQESVKSYLTRIAVSLAQDDVWLDKDIRERLAAGESVSLLEMTLPIPLADSTESRVVEGGKTFEIRVELYFDGQAPKILTNNFTEYRVALDPDIFFTRSVEDDYLQDSFVPTFSSLPPSNVAKMVKVGVETPLDFPLFLISLAEKDDPNLPKPSVRENVIYLTFKSVTLRTKKDKSAEEFELYLSDGNDPINSPFLVSTTHKFDGASRLDASGINVTYPDVNQKQTYTAAFPIALKELNNTTQYRLVAIDDDKDAGVHKNDESGPIVTRNIDYYNVLTNLINPNTASTFSVIHTSANPDDIYYKSGVIHINLSNVLARIGNGTDFNTDQATNGQLEDLKWVLSKR